MRRTWIGLLAFLLLPPPTADAQPALNLHLRNITLQPGCDGITPANMSCSDLVVEGNSTTTQLLYVLTSGIGDVAGVQFGVEYPSTVDVESWTGCTDGLSIPSTAWPDSGSGLAITWDPPAAPTSTDSLVMVGYFRIGAGSTGAVSLIPDPQTGQAEYADSESVAHTFDESRLAVADVDGDGAGDGPCGSGEPMGGGGSSSTSAPVAFGVPPVLREPDSETTVACGEPSGGSVRWTQTENDDQYDRPRGIHSRYVPGGSEPGVFAVRSYDDVSATRSTQELERRHTSDGDKMWTVALPQGKPAEDPHPRMNLMRIAGGDVYVTSTTHDDLIYVGRFDDDSVDFWEVEIHNQTVDGDDDVAGMGFGASGLLVGGSAYSATEFRMAAYRLDPTDGELLDHVTLTGYAATTVDAATSPPGTANPVLALAGHAATASGQLTVVALLDATTLDVIRFVSIDDDEYDFYPAVIRVDEKNNVFVAGVAVEQESPEVQRTYVARIGNDGVGSEYLALIDDASADATPREIHGLVATSGQLAFVFVEVDHEPSEVSAYRVDANGTVRWRTRFACDDEPVLGGALDIREEDFTTIVTYGSPDPDATDCCEEASCLHAAALDALDGSLLSNVHATTCSGSGDVSIPRAMSLEVFPPSSRHAQGVADVDGQRATSGEEGAGVYVAGTLAGTSSTDASFVAFELPVRSYPLSTDPPDAGVVIGRLAVSATGLDGTLRISVRGGREGVVVDVFDVSGRRVHEQTLESGVDRMVLGDLTPGIYFVRATSELGNAHDRTAVMR